MITSKEYELLKEYRRLGYKWIARDKSKMLYVYNYKPFKVNRVWDTSDDDTSYSYILYSCHADIFKSITWEDEKPTKIDDLIRDYESYQSSVGEKVKVTIPQFIELWIKGIRAIMGDVNLFEAYDDLKRDIWDNPRLSEEHRKTAIKICRWICDNPDTFIDAWRNGYMVEKEKMYMVELPNRQRLSKIGDTIKFCDEREWFVKDLKTQLTQAEIESIDPVLMQIAKEVE